ncbi:MAG: GCN5-related N-acetyltransferase [Bacillales bacterium]|jgi:predicted acetyltransferase|nr:GCN5-related N-acetyltransferase [Bacillales bacterium]
MGLVNLQTSIERVLVKMMNKLKLISPTAEHEHLALEFLQEFKEYGSEINGTGGLQRYSENYSEWLVKLRNDLDVTNMQSDRVPSTTFFVYRKEDNRMVGMINIRHKLNDYLLKEGGHIGYGIRPTERRKGYATETLYLGLQLCKELSIDKVLVTCDKDNIGSARTIQKNGGVLENEILDSQLAEVLQRYWIDVHEALNNISW